MKKSIFTAILIAAALMFGGCGKSSDVTIEKIVAANDIDILLSAEEKGGKPYVETEVSHEVAVKDSVLLTVTR